MRHCPHCNVVLTWPGKPCPDCAQVFCGNCRALHPCPLAPEAIAAEVEKFRSYIG